MQLLPFPISPLELFGPIMNTFSTGTLPPENAKLLYMNRPITPNPPPPTPNAKHKLFNSILLQNPKHHPTSLQQADTPGNQMKLTRGTTSAANTKAKAHTPYTNTNYYYNYLFLFGREICFANGSVGLTALSIHSHTHKGPSPNNTRELPR